MLLPVSLVLGVGTFLSPQPAANIATTAAETKIAVTRIAYSLERVTGQPYRVPRADGIGSCRRLL
jgi:hypothetical protein